MSAQLQSMLQLPIILHISILLEVIKLLMYSAKNCWKFIVENIVCKYDSKNAFHMLVSNTFLLYSTKKFLKSWLLNNNIILSSNQSVSTLIST